MLCTNTLRKLMMQLATIDRKGVKPYRACYVMNQQYKSMFVGGKSTYKD